MRYVPKSKNKSMPEGAGYDGPEREYGITSEGSNGELERDAGRESNSGEGNGRAEKFELNRGRADDAAAGGGKNEGCGRDGRDGSNNDGRGGELGRGRRGERAGASRTLPANIFGIVLLAVLFLFSLAVYAVLLHLNFLPARYAVLLGVLLLAFWALMLLFQVRRGKIRAVGKVIILVFCVIYAVGLVYLIKTSAIINSISSSSLSGGGIKTNMVVIVKSDSPAYSLSDLSGSVIGVPVVDFDEDNIRNALNDLAENGVDFTESYVEGSYTDAVGALLDELVDAAVINEAFWATIEETYADLDNLVRILTTYTYEEATGTTKTANDVDIMAEPFIVYLSGNDSYGTVSYAGGRSDVNILLVVNPAEKRLLMVTTPRDYFVGLSGDLSKMDKLTHAGIYGVDVSEATLEALYGIEINYYARINFSGFKQIVDALGGVNVYSEYSFSTKNSKGYSFTEGYNYVDGAAALAFVRERYSFSDGDVQRGRNQMAMIKAIFEKIASPSILLNYVGFLDSIDGCVMTDMSAAKIGELVQLLLNTGSDWDITSYTAEGSGSYSETYSMPGTLLYVMNQDPASIAEAKRLIEEAANGSSLSSD